MDIRSTQVTFKDVAGCEEAKEELKEVIDFLRILNFKIGSHGSQVALLVGPPGTGKTLLARAVAGEVRPFYSLSGADLLKCLLELVPPELGIFLNKLKKFSLYHFY